MSDDRRSNDIPWGEPARILAILYTIGYFAIVFMMMSSPLPDGNEASLNQLIGALTIIQTGIIAFYFRGSKADETVQNKIMASKDKTDDALVQIAKAAPAPIAAEVPAALPPAAAVDTMNVQAENVEVNQPKEGPK